LILMQNRKTSRNLRRSYKIIRMDSGHLACMVAEYGRALTMSNQIRQRFNWALLLLLIPYIGLLWVPFYNHADPAILGVPFFYWYQFAWIPITIFLTWISYRASHD
jgi:Protein of unknown function (DUF3311)